MIYLYKAYRRLVCRHLLRRERCSPAAKHRTIRPTEPTSPAPSKTRRRL